MALTANSSNRGLLAPSGTPRNLVFILICAVAALQMLGAHVLDLIVGEAYYLASTRQWHLSFYDQPPISLWIISATRLLTGSEDPLALRLPFIALYAGTNWLIYRIGARYRSEWAGFFAALVMNIAILFILSVGSWLQPEAPLMLFWLATCWVLMDVFFNDADGRPYWKWGWVGFWLGLTFLTKYHAVFLVAGAGLFALTNSRARGWIAHPGPYLAMAIATLIALPVVVWNWQNAWVSFDFQGGRAFGDGFHPEWLLRMIVGQLLYESPWIALPALAAAGLAAWRGPKGVFPLQTLPGFAWFLLCMAFWPIVFFTAVAAWSDTQFHFHWQAPGYMMLFILLGGWVDAAWARHRLLIKSWLYVSAALTLAILVVLASHTVTGWMRHVLPGGMRMVDPTIGALKWRELGAWFDARPIKADEAFVAGLNWTECGQIDTPLAGRLPLACLAADPRNIAFNVNLAEMAGRTAYIVALYEPSATVIERFAEFFESFEEVANLQIMRGGMAEFGNLRIIEARDFKMSRPIAANGDARVEITRLPRTKIASIAGSINNGGPAQSIELYLDGQAIGTLDVAGHGKTSFLMPVPAPDWSVGMDTVALTIKAPPGLAGQVGFVELFVTVE